MLTRLTGHLGQERAGLLRLILLATALGGLLFVTIIPGFFSVDEPHYLASVVGLRHGQLTLPGMEGLPVSPELDYFNPGPSRPIVALPYMPTVPPLYAFLALPFSYLGVDGLFLINTIAFVGIVLLVFLYTRQHAQTRQAPWFAVATFALASYTIEYAQAVWPHLLAVLFCTLTVYMISRTRTQRRAWPLLIAGLSAGLATGIRYQNFIVAASAGLSVLLWQAQPLQGGIAYGLGVALPLGASALLNYHRFGRWNPISKGPGYLRPGKMTAASGSFWQPVSVFWTRVVDYSTHPERSWYAFALSPDPQTGAIVLLGAVKKAWLQSCPWLVLPLAATLWSWLKRRRCVALPAQQTEWRALSLIVWPTLFVFSIAGYQRTDGFCFNQRYFLELMPFCAVGLAWLVERVSAQRRYLLCGLLLGAAGAYLTLVQPTDDPSRHRELLVYPLILASALAVTWVMRQTALGRSACIVVLGASLAWSAMVHLGDDLHASRRGRFYHAELTRLLRDTLVDQSAVFTWGWPRNTAAPLHLDRDLVVLDAMRDQGRDAPRLVHALLDQGRRVFVVTVEFPRDVLAEMTRGLQRSPTEAASHLILEIHRNARQAGHL